MANIEKVVTEELVFEVAGQLKAQGQTPTNRAVLRITGGSMTTVAAYLRKWKEEQNHDSPTVENAALEIPQSVTDALAHAGRLIWQAAAAEIRKEIDGIQEHANQRVKEAESEREQVLMELDEAESELGEVRRQLEEARKEVERLTAAVQHEQQRAGAEQARAVELANQVTDLQGERERLHAEVTEARRDTKQAEMQAANLAGQVQALTAALDAFNGKQPGTGKLKK